MKLSRILACLLCLVVALSLFGCEKIDLSGGKKPGNSQNGGISDPSDPNVLVVKTTVKGSEAFRPQGGSSPKIDRILTRISDVERATGKTVDVEILSEETLSERFLRACRAGNKYADVIQADAMFLSRYYDEGYFCALSEVGLEASQTGSLKKSDGTAYAFRADGWNNPLPTVSNVLFYNEKILTERHCETPLELYEEGAWNWVNFEKICKKVPNGGEVFALAHPNQENSAFVWAFLHGAGLTYFTDDGVCVMDSEDGLNGFSKLKTFLSSGVTYALGSYENSTADPTAKLAFTNRRTAFLVEHSSLLFETGDDSLSEALGDDLRIIGFPSLKKGISGASYSVDDVFCGITFTANKDLCKTLLPLLFEESQEGAFRSELADDYFYHEEDAEIYFDLLASADTDTSLSMTDDRPVVEEYFLQMAEGYLSVKEYLNNLQSLFNFKNSQ